MIWQENKNRLSCSIIKTAEFLNDGLITIPDAQELRLYFLSVLFFLLDWHICGLFARFGVGDIWFMLYVWFVELYSRI